MSMPTPQTHVRYYRTEAGGIGMVEESHPGSTRLPAGAVELDKAAYDAATAEWQDAKRQHVDELRAADRARLTDDYDALVAAGIPDVTARRLSGLDRLDKLEGQ